MNRNPKARSSIPTIKDYYSEKDFETITKKLPSLVEEAERKAADELEPTINEKWKVIESIKEFIRNNPRKVYGGTALNEALKLVDPKDEIYSKYKFGDIEFYSYTPVNDLVNLCNYLTDLGYNYVVGSDAQHEGTYKVFVNMAEYCDISYVPQNIYDHIKTIKIDGIDYVHPHFAWIDYLKMFTNPLTSSWRWEKAFKRTYLLLKDYPPEYFDKPIKINKPSKEIQRYQDMIVEEFMVQAEGAKSDMLSGIVAYNYFIKTAFGEEEKAEINRISSYDFYANIPYVDILSVDYVNTVMRLYNYLKAMIPITTGTLTIEEYFPFFHYINYSCHIKLGDKILARVVEGDGTCVAYVKVVSGRHYVCYQYLQAVLLVEKFRNHVENDQQMYFNYGSAFSNLIKARNYYLKEHNSTPLDKSIFKEFKTDCRGKTVSFERLNKLRQLERRQAGKPAPLRYKAEDVKQREGIHKYAEYMRHHPPLKIDGEQINNPKKLRFNLSPEGIISENKFYLQDEKDKKTEITEFTKNIKILPSDIEASESTIDGLEDNAGSSKDFMTGGDDLDEIDEIGPESFI